MKYHCVTVLETSVAMKSNKLAMIIFFVLLLLSPGTHLSAQPDASLTVGSFSSAPEGDGLPPGWKPLTFKNISRHTRYSLVKDNGTVVLKATSRASASGLIRKIKIDPKAYPIIQWRWKVSNIYQKGDVTQKKGDDYPARIYINFAHNPDDLNFIEKLKYETFRLFYGEYPPGGALVYIWESKLPIGTVARNPHTDKAMMIVVESGDMRLNQWVQEERNVFEDYHKVFGKKPPMVSSIAIMTDLDNTKESAVSYYGDITLKKNE